MTALKRFSACGDKKKRFDKFDWNEYKSQEVFKLRLKKNKKDREAILSEFRKFRKKISGKQSAASKTLSLLLQLKFLMEDYLQDNTFNKNLYFGYFLKEYIARLEKKNKQFAYEIDVNPAELSQIINKHRKPTEKIIFRLDIHSNKNFPATMWFKLLEKERLMNCSKTAK